MSGHVRVLARFPAILSNCPETRDLWHIVTFFQFCIDCTRMAYTAPATAAPSPVLGSAYLTSQSSIPPSSPSELGTSICLNLSLFKTTLKRYRALDDAITTRLNRDAALHRADVLDVNEEPQRRTCLRVWADILGEPLGATFLFRSLY